MPKVSQYVAREPRQCKYFDFAKFSADVRMKRALEREGICALARRIGISYAAIYNVESERFVPSVDNLIPLLRWLDKPLEEYMMG